jgi:hypothetical protein
MEFFFEFFLNELDNSAHFTVKFSIFNPTNKWTNYHVTLPYLEIYSLYKKSVAPIFIMQYLFNHNLN